MRTPLPQFSRRTSWLLDYACLDYHQSIDDTNQNVVTVSFLEMGFVWAISGRGSETMSKSTINPARREVKWMV